ncbi:hypothetical protein NXU92_22355 [Bacteroides fragilis]|nr:hypothetical protein [Bacteroides fragilis]
MAHTQMLKGEVIYGVVMRWVAVQPTMLQRKLLCNLVSSGTNV